MNQPPFATLRHRGEHCLSDLHLDRFAAGECIGPAATTHINQCSVCAQQLQERRDDQVRFNAGPQSQVNKFKARAAKTAPSRIRKFKARPAFAITAAAAAVVLLAVVPRSASDVRTKGGTSLRVITATHPDHTLRDGDTVPVGERLRFLVDTETPIFVTVLGRDSDGSVWNAAVAPTGMTPLPAGASQLLPGAVMLDEEGDNEDIQLFACAQQTDIGKLVAHATDATKNSLPAGCTVTHTHVRKAKK